MESKGEACISESIREATEKINLCNDANDGEADAASLCPDDIHDLSKAKMDEKRQEIPSDEEILTAISYTNKNFVYREFLNVVKLSAETLRTKDLNAVALPGEKIDFPDIAPGVEDAGAIENKSCEVIEQGPIAPESMVDIADLKQRPNTIFEEKVLVCRNVAFPRMKGNRLITLITDKHGQDVVFLESSNVKPIECGLSDFLNLVSRACVVLIRNPTFTKTEDGRYSVVVSDLNLLNFLTDALFKDLMPDFKWVQIDVLPTTLNSVKNDDVQLAKEWAYLGSKYFIEKNYMYALDCYNVSIRLNPFDVSTLVHRSATFIPMGVYSAALKDSEQALNIDPYNIKAVNRKTRALWCLRKYKEAMMFLEAVLTETTEQLKESEKKFVEELKQQCKTLIRQQQSGEYDWMKFYRSPSKRADDQAEFIGSLKLSTNTEGIKGLYATKDIRCGELIMAVRAYAAIVPGDDSCSEWDSKINHLSAYVINKIKYDTEETRKEFFELPVGPDQNLLEHQGTEIDLPRIVAMCELNGFGMEHKCADGCEPIEFRQATFGIWILPSYFRHSCLGANCLWRACGDFLFVRAITDISAGQELLIPYEDISSPFHVRKIILDRFGFSCDCRLCKLDEKDSFEIRYRREEIVESIGNIMLSHEVIDSHVISILFNHVTGLENLRPKNPKMNFPILDPLQNIGMAYFAKKKFKKSLTCFERAYNIAEGSPLIGTLVYVTMNLVVVSVKCGQIHKAKKWAKMLKKYLMIGFGCVEIIELISLESVDLMKENGIDIFSMS